MRTLIAALAGAAAALAVSAAGAQTPAPATNTEAPAADTPISAASPKASVETTTIGDLIADPATKGVLQKDMPELLSYDGLDQIKGMTMRDISKYPQANLDQARLVKIQKDFDAITP
ncbi:MAG TPA: hypothetical protein VGN38_00845 [Caulobacteraceae bacterium]|jgi:hypothetical protein|nr:hypothetical protein [Caulobacteraceae bacterium]